MYRYEIDEFLIIRIFEDDSTIPFWLQPDYPNEEAFDDLAEATQWAEYAVASMEPEGLMPPNGKGQPCLPKVKANGIS